MDEQWRVQFDAMVTFANGGNLEAYGFRLDVPGDDITDAALAELFVRHLGLLMVDRVQIANKTLIREPHKGSRGVAAIRGARRLIELSHMIRDGMITYPGLPAPTITEYLSREESRTIYAPGTEFQIGRITMISNTGTYLDAPFHRFAGGDDLAALPLSRTVDLAGVVVRATDLTTRAVDRPILLPYDVAGKAVLIHTGWDRHWGSETYGSDRHPYLTEAAAAWLVDNGAALVGIDSINIDDMADRRRPAHTLLLGAGVPIVEHLRGLEQLPPSGFGFHAAPLAVQGMGTFPVRAYALID